MSEQKPIFDIKDDIQKVIVSVDKLHKDVNDLRKLNKEMIDIIANRLANKDNIVIPPKSKGWFY
jgi:geranylgeranyl pyrophosphate synthase|tara:strand:+ start:131 stop:322 length:192 start_codon:yes stop_codon:yes gene_type:complete